MLIRAALLSDCSAIAKIHVKIWAEVYPYIPPSVHNIRNVEYRKKQWIDAVTCQNASHNPVAVLERDETVAGFSQVKQNSDPDLPDPDFELHACYLPPVLRGTAAGPTMMQSMLDDIVALGGTSCVIWVWVKNPIKWTYFGLGFTTQFRRTRTIGGVELPEIGVVSYDLQGLKTSLNTMIMRIEQASPSENRLRRPSRQNPICERIDKSQVQVPKLAPASPS